MTPVKMRIFYCLGVMVFLQLSTQMLSAEIRVASEAKVQQVVRADPNEQLRKLVKEIAVQSKDGKIMSMRDNTKSKVEWVAKGVDVRANEKSSESKAKPVYMNGLKRNFKIQKYVKRFTNEPSSGVIVSPEINRFLGDKTTLNVGSSIPEKGTVVSRGKQAKGRRVGPRVRS